MKMFARSLALMAAMATIAGGTVAVSVAQEKGKAQPTKKAEAAKEGRFEVYKDKGGKFRFRIFGTDGKQLGMAHIGYESKDDCVAAIKAIQDMAGKAKITDEK